MNKTNVAIIGSNSDLIAPLLEKSEAFSFLKLTREDWDLNSIANDNLCNQIIEFNPQHIIFAAAVNNPVDINNITQLQLAEAINYHMNVNCISIVSLITFLNKKLLARLSGLHIISSLYGIYGRKTRLPYSLSKHALEGAIKCLALELPQTTVLGYRPGFFKTKLTDKNLSREQQNNIIKKIPMNRLGKASDLCNLVEKNILDPPKYATGSIINLDGGLTSGSFFDFT